MTNGTVTGLYRYPVKSMLGQSLQSANIDAVGVSGDRCYALQDVQTGKIASAKLPHRWQKMLYYRARMEGPDNQIWIKSPDGNELQIGSVELDQAISADLGRDVRMISQRSAGLTLDWADPNAIDANAPNAELPYVDLELGMAAPNGGFFDFAPVHLVTETSLNEISRISASGGTEVARFRPNFIVDMPDSRPFDENGWVGGQIELGTAILQIIIPTPRCAIPTLAQTGLEKDVRLTHKLGQINSVDIPELGKSACLGAYAAVVKPGIVAQGDAVRLIPA